MKFININVSTCFPEVDKLDYFNRENRHIWIIIFSGHPREARNNFSQNVHMVDTETGQKFLFLKKLSVR